MTTKTVYQTNLNGIYVGPTDADESPLEPGVFLVPFGAHEKQPPALTKDQLARWVDNDWVVEDVPHPTEPVKPELTREQKVAVMKVEIQAYMDNAARDYGYGNIFTAVSYADEPAVEKFQMEGRAFRAWRSLVWAKCYELLDEVNAGTRPEMTTEEVIQELPALQLP